MQSKVIGTSRLAVLAIALTVAGCANPADDKFQVTATAPKPESPAPAPAAATPDPQPAVTTALAPGALVIDPAASKVEFIGSKVTGSHSGGFKEFTGAVEMSPDQATVAKVAVEIDMNSTWSDNGNLTGHLKSADFFDVPKHPKSTFVSTEIKPGGEKGASHTITGNLTLHGVTKSIAFPATISTKDGAVTLASEFAINRKDFAINYPGRANDLIRDEVVIKLDVRASKKS